MTTALPNLPTLGTAPTPAAVPSTRFSPLDPMRIFRQYWMVLTIAVVVGTALGVASHYLVQSYMPTWTTNSLLKATGGVQKSTDTPEDAAGNTQGQLEQVASFIKNQSLVIVSDDVLSKALARPEITATDWFQSFYKPEPGDSDVKVQAERLSRAKEELQKHYKLEASQVRGSTFMQVNFQSRFAGQQPRTILDTIVNVYVEQLQFDNENRFREIRGIFLKESTDAELEQKRIEDQKRQYMVDQDLPNIIAQNHEAQIAYQLMADQWTKLTITAQAAREAYNKMLKEEPVTDSTELRMYAEQDPAVYQRTEKIRALREQRAVMVERYGPEHRAVQDLDRTIDAMELERKREMDRLIRERQNLKLEDARKTAESMEMQLAGIIPELEKARRAMKDLSIKIQGFEQLADRAKAAADKRQKADELLNEIRVKGIRPDAVRVYRQQVAVEPEMTWPLKLYYWIPLAAVLVVGVTLGVIFLKELLDQRVRYPGDLKVLPKAELLGVVPLASEDPSGTSRVEGAVLRDSKGLMAEAFRQTRTALVTHMDRRGYKTLMVTCARPQSGVSSIVSNLAVSMALNGRKVLVLDANLRRPAQHRHFDTAQEPGLVEVLHGQVPIEQALVHKTDPDVDVLPAGATRDVPPEVLESQAFRSLLSQLESRYDIILIDAPPALLASDCQMLAKQADAVALVVRAMAEKRGMIGRMMRLFEGLRAETLGIILNGARSSAGGYFRENYQQFYRYRQTPAIKGLGGGRKPAEAARR